MDDDAAPPDRKVSLPKWMEKEEVSGLKKLLVTFGTSVTGTFSSDQSMHLKKSG